MGGPAVIWRKAIEDFLAEKHQAGDILEHGWFLDHFQMTEVPEIMTKKEWEKWNLKFLSFFMPFRDHLLKNHFIDLQAVGGENYQIIPPPEQTKTAMNKLSGNYKSIHKRCVSSLTYLNKDGLTQQQIQENADALNKVAQLKSLSQPIWRNTR